LKADAKFIEHHPSYVPKAMLWSTVRLFDLRGTRDALFMAQFLPYPRQLTILSVYVSYLLEILAVVGVFVRTSRNAPRAVWWVPVLAFLTIILLSGDIRYRASIEPFTVLFASVAIAKIIDLLHLLPAPLLSSARLRA
jgi:hypothetical protein